MDRRFLFLGIAIALIAGLLAIFWWAGDRYDGGWHGATVDRVVTTSDGQTLVIHEGRDGNGFGFFPFVPFFFPVFWILLIGGFFFVFGRRRWGGGPPYGPGPQTRDEWLTAWHQRQHSGSARESGDSPVASDGEPRP